MRTVRQIDRWTERDKKSETDRGVYIRTDEQTIYIYSRSWLEERQKVSVMERQDIRGNKTIHGNEYSKSNSYTGIRLISFATDVGPQNISRFRRFNN